MPPHTYPPVRHVIGIIQVRGGERVVLTLGRVGWPGERKGTPMRPTRARPRGRMSLQPKKIGNTVVGGME